VKVKKENPCKPMKNRSEPLAECCKPMKKRSEPLAECCRHLPFIKWFIWEIYVQWDYGYLPICDSFMHDVDIFCFDFFAQEILT